MHNQIAQILSNKERAIISIAAFTSNGQLESLKNSLEYGLDVGLTISAIKAVIVQLYAYTGFPRSLNGLAVFMAVLKARKQRSITDEEGEYGAVMAQGDSLTVGARNQTQLVGQKVTGALFEFAPAIDTYLKAHLFGDIFQSGALSWKERELATIAALASMEGVNAQLQAHYGIAMNNGVTVVQLNEFISIIRKACGNSVALNASNALNAVLG